MSHRSPPNICVTLGALVIGTAIGWYWPGDSSTQGPSRPKTPTVLVPSVEKNVTSVPEQPSPESTADFDERLKAVFATGNRLKRKRIVAAIADELDATQIREALAKMEKLHGTEQREIKKRLYLRWGAIDPEAALEHARKLKEYDLAVGPLIKGWVAKDRDEARAAIEKIPEEGMRKQAASSLIEALSETDPKEAFELAGKLGAHSDYLETLFKNWTAKSPEEAAAYSTKDMPDGDKRAAVRAVAKAWAETDLPRAVQWLESLLEKDTAAGSGIRSPFALILAKWMDNDSDGAIRWIEGRPNDSKSEALLAEASVETMFQTRDPLLSTKIISLLPPGDSRKMAFNNLMYQWGLDDPEGAIDWMENQSEDVQRDVLPPLAWQFGESDPERAIKFVAKLGEKGAEVLDRVISAWASRQPAAAAEWVRGQPVNPDLLAAVANQWVQRDSARATEWINSVEDSPAKDSALGQIAERFTSSHPEIAVEWVAGIRDEKARKNAYKDVVDFWIYSDPIAVRKWLATAPLPEDMKTRFEKELNK